MKPFYKTFFLLFLNVLFLVINSFSQAAPGIEWQNTIGGGSLDELFATVQTNDGGYIIGGKSNSDFSGDKNEACLGYFDYWIIKLNALGNIQWQNTIGGSDDDQLRCIEQTNDGGYIVGGYSDSNISGDKAENSKGGSDYWIIKLNVSGNIQWQKTIGGNNDDYLFSIQQTLDGGYILGGSSISDSSGDKTENSDLIDYWVVKLDSTGSIQWQNTIGGNNFDWIKKIQQTTDGGYILGGVSNSDSSDEKTENSIGLNDYWVVKLDSIGNITWQNTIGGSNEDVLWCLQQTTDSGYILGGMSQSNISGDKTENSMGFGDYWIVKLHSSGIIQWQNTIGGNSGDALYSIQQTNDDGFILAGTSSSNISGDKTENSIGINNYEDYWIVKINSVGTIIWQNTIGGDDNDWICSVQQTNDNGFIIGGSSYSQISGDKTENTLLPSDYWIVKLFPDTITSISNLQPPSFNFQISPNPTTGIFQITFPSSSNQKTNYTLEVISTLGQTVYAKQLQTPNSKLQTNLDVSFLPKGIYVLIINDGVAAFSSKFVIE